MVKNMTYTEARVPSLNIWFCFIMRTPHWLVVSTVQVKNNAPIYIMVAWWIPQKHWCMLTDRWWSMYLYPYTTSHAHPIFPKQKHSKSIIFYFLYLKKNNNTMLNRCSWFTGMYCFCCRYMSNNRQVQWCGIWYLYGSLTLYDWRVLTLL